MRIRYLVFSCVLVVLAGSIFYFLPRIIKVTDIACSSQYGYCPEDVVSAIEGSKNKNYYQAKKEILSYLKSNPAVEKYLIQFKLYSKLSVSLIIRKAKYSIKNTATNKYYLVDDGKMVISVLESSNLPFVECDNCQYGLNDQVDDGAFVALRVFYQMNNLYKIEYAKLMADYLEIKISDGPKVLFASDQEPDTSVGGARLIIEQLNSPSQKIKIGKSLGDITLDMRYKNPIIK
jgi:hypothetical protein